MNDRNRFIRHLSLVCIGIMIISLLIFYYVIIEGLLLLLESARVRGSFAIFFSRLTTIYYAYRTQFDFLFISGWMLFTLYTIQKFFLYQMACLKYSLSQGKYPQTPMHMLPIIVRMCRRLEGQHKEMLLQQKQAIQAQERKHDIIVYLAHDLKTPLTSIIGYLHVLQDSSLSLKQSTSSYHHIIIDKLERLEQLRGEFIMAVHEEKQDSLCISEVSIRELLQSLCEDFMIEAKQKQCAIILHCEKAWSCPADFHKLIRLFSNLIKNAIAYGEAKHDIEIVVEATQDAISIRVTNKSMQIKKVQIQHIFDKFYRGDEARTSYRSGAGLGLAIAKEIVVQHQGEISASMDNNDVTLQVLLPKAGVNHAA